MALQTSGQISMGDIRSELGTIATNFSLDGAESGLYGAINQNSTFRPNGSVPNAISEWYGYDHNAGVAGCTCYTLYGGGRTGGTFGYEDCVTGQLSFVTVDIGFETNVCARTGTVYVSSGGGFSEESLNDCCQKLYDIKLYYDDFDTCPTREDFFYINAQTFSGASEIYSDQFGTPAPDGYYGYPSCCYRAWFGGSLGIAYLC